MERSRGEEEEEEDGGRRGAGGKLTKRSFQRKQSTPYDRPPPGDRERGWLSKLLVEPASRILPSLFSSSTSSSNHHQAVSATRPTPEIEQEDRDGGSKLAPHLQNYCPLTEETGTSVEKCLPNGGSGRSELLCDNDGKVSAGNELSEVEHWLKGKIFSSDESNRIVELLRSRMIGPPGDGGHSIGPTVEAKEDASCQKDISCSAKNKHAVEPDWRMTPKRSDPLLTAHKEVGSSPVEVAKAYMQGLTSPFEHDRHNASLHEGSALNSAFSPFVKPSICWPGAVVQDNLVYSTPHSQRDRFGPFDGPQTPYSGAFPLKATPKFRNAGERSSNLKSSGSKQPLTPIFGSNKVVRKRSAVLDDGLTSSGPVRLVRQKTGTSTPSGAISSNPRSYFSSLSGSADALNSSSTFLINHARGSAKPSFFQPADAGPQLPKSTVGSSTVHPQSSEMARKILEHLNRSVPSPKDRSLELKIALTKSRTPSDSAPVMDDMDDGRPVRRALDNHIAGCLLGTDAQDKASAQKKFTGPSSSKRIHGEDLLSCPLKTNEQGKIEPLYVAAKIEMFSVPKPLSHSSSDTSDSTSICPAKSSWGLEGFPDISAGFTFPVQMDTNAYSEPPPTPTLSASVAVRRMTGDDEETIPSFMFGQTEAGTNHVFSFGSIAGSNFIDTNLPKFTFGSNKLRRLTFRSIAEDTICY